MKKTFWWRGVVLFVGGIVLGSGYLAINDSKLFVYNSYTDSSMFLSLFLVVVSLFLFLVSDKVFIKWLKFALLWFGLTIILVIMAPVYRGGWLGIGPTKESVSIWMGSLFAILSLGQFIWYGRKNK